MIPTPPDPPTAMNIEASSAFKRPHLPFLDGVRALAALLVVFYHIRTFHREETVLSLPVRILTNLTLYGHFAVGVFIVLSGFCLMLPIACGEGRLPYTVLAFYKRRAHRILPPYYFAMLFSLGLIGLGLSRSMATLWDYSLPVTGFSLVAHLLLLQNFLGGYMRINPVLWSVAVEWQLYLFFPLFVLSFRRWGAVWITAAAGMVSFLGVWWVHHHRFAPLGLYLTPQYLGLFVMGMFGAQSAFGPLKPGRQRRDIPWGSLTLGMAGVILATRLAIGGPQFINANYEYMDLLIGPCISFLLIYLAVTPQSVLRHALDFPPLVAVGLFSYSLYLVHLPLLQLFWQYGMQPFGFSSMKQFLLLIFPGLPLVVAAAYLFHLVAERPFMNSKKQQSLRLALQDSNLSAQNLSQE